MAASSSRLLQFLTCFLVAVVPAFAAITPLPDKVPAAIPDAQDYQVPDRVQFGPDLVGQRVAGNEAAGRGGDESTFILLQAVLRLGVPRVWARGGIGPRAAAESRKRKRPGMVGAFVVVPDGA